MKVIIKKQFDKQLEKLPKTVQESAVSAIKKLYAAKTLSDTNLDYLKISGQKKGENLYRIRLGNYRIGIELIQPTVIVITIFHRQDDYKNFP